MATNAQNLYFPLPNRPDSELSFFVLAVVVAAGLQWYIRRGANALIVSQDFKRFQWLWLLVYYIVMCTDTFINSPFYFHFGVI